MSRLASAGVEMDLPPGWDGRIRRPPADRAIAAQVPEGERPPHRPTIAHAATVPLPTDPGDFGSGAVERLGSSDVFLALVEFEPESASTPLFSATGGLPRRLRGDDFHPQGLQRTLPGQSGMQAFLNEGGRAFCLYVVLGSHAMRWRSVPRCNEALRGIRIT